MGWFTLGLLPRESWARPPEDPEYGEDNGGNVYTEALQGNYMQVIQSSRTMDADGVDFVSPVRSHVLLHLQANIQLRS